MKTANPKIDLFKKYDQAKKHFDALTVPAHLLQCYVKGISKCDYFVEILTKGEKSAIECWPTHYIMIEKK